MANKDNTKSTTDTNETSKETPNHERKVIQFEGDNLSKVDVYAKQLMTDRDGFINMMILMYENLTPQEKAELVIAQAQKVAQALIANNS